MGGPVFTRPVEGVDDGNKHYGVLGRSNREAGVGVLGLGTFFGVSGRSDNGLAGVNGESLNLWGVRGVSDRHNGVQGFSNIRSGVAGQSNSGNGVYGFSSSHIGVSGQSNTGFGVTGRSNSQTGMFGQSNTGIGVAGQSNNGDGVIGFSENWIGVHGVSRNHIGMVGETDLGVGVRGYGKSFIGVVGSSDSGIGVYCFSRSGYAAYLDGSVYIRGPLEKPAGSFKIDHPLDPANKYLYHSFVESPDMKNIYDGVVALDNKGEAEIELPDWFGALNKEFRYQLTAIGAPSPNLYIAEEISDDATNDSNSSKGNNNNHFKIAGGTPGTKVSWNVTGIRRDPWANAHRIQVEENKPDKERGYYLHPDLYSQPEETGLSHLLFPEAKQARAAHKRE